MRWILACLLLSTGAAHAADPVESAKELAGEGKLVDAATVLGKAIAKEQRAGDVPAVIDLCDKLIEIVGVEVRPLDDPARNDTYREVCHALMKTLDAKRRDAVLSAQMLATELVLQATHAGDERFLEEAVKIVRLHGKDKKAGLCASTTALFADALLDARKGEEGATARIHEAYRVMMQNGWYDLAVYAAVEVSMDANYDPGVGVLADMNARLPKGDIQLLRTALDVMLHRMRTRNIPEGGKARFDPPDKGTRAGAGDTSVSPIGAKWKRLSRTKAFVSATRAVDRFRVEYRFVDEEKTQPVQPGVKYQAHGGVTLSFRGAAVRLEMLDLVGNRAQPGEQRSGPACFQLYYHLAPGETWDVTRRGVVEIRRKR